MSQVEKRFLLSANEHFMERRGPAWNTGNGGCQKKQCFVATDRALLADVLRELAQRRDFVYVKYSTYSRDGMYLDRCFLMDEHEVGVLWAEHKEHPRLFCSVPEDDFAAPFRPVE